MFEGLAIYQQMDPLAAAILLFLLGLAVGSFSSVLLHRLPLGRSILWPRSHCPVCTHTLGLIDLIPVLSYLLAGGKCRYCLTPVPWRYVGLEVASGIVVAAAGLVWGITAGLITALIWALGAAALGKARRMKLLRDESGFTLIEVLVACLLLSMAAAAVFGTLNTTRKNSRAAYQRTMAVGLARQRLARAAEQARRTAGPPVAGTDVPHTVYPEYLITTTAHDYPGQVGQCWVVTVIVECPTCTVPISDGKGPKVLEVVCK